MKHIIFIICLLASQAVALTPRERQLVEGLQAAGQAEKVARIGEEAARKAAEVKAEAVVAELRTVKTLNAAQAADISKTETQTKQITKERDDWKHYAEDQQAKNTKLQISLAKSQKHVWQLLSLSIGLTIAALVLIYLLLKP